MPDKEYPPAPGKEDPGQSELVDTLTELQEKRVSSLRTKVLSVLIVVMCLIVALPLLVSRDRAERLAGRFDAARRLESVEVPADAQSGADQELIAAIDRPPRRAPSPRSGPGRPPVEELIARAAAASGIPPQDASALAEMIASQSRTFGADPLWTAAIVAAESSFNPKARGKNGKLGLMQISPQMEKEILKLRGLRSLGGADLYDPGYNLSLGLWYIKFLEHFFDGRADDALAAFNMGVKPFARAKESGSPLPQEARGYLAAVNEFIARFAETPAPARSEEPAPSPAAAPSPQPSADPAPSPPSPLPPGLSSILEPVVLPAAEKLVLGELVLKHSADAGMDADLVGAVIMAESTFNAAAAGPGGRIGLLQIDPSQAESLAHTAGIAWEGPDQLADPSINLRLGLILLKKSLEEFPGDLDSGLLSFNLGKGEAEKIKQGLSPLPKLAQRYLHNIRTALARARGA